MIRHAYPATEISCQASPDPASIGFALEQDERGGLCLRAEHRSHWKPLRIDWESGEQRSRILAGRKQLLARALALPAIRSYRVLDATAGLGRDAFTLAALGAQVTLTERNPQLVALLRDAQERTRRSTRLWAREAADRLTILAADALDLTAEQGPFDAALLDPMYPQDNKAALPQKQMQMLRELVGDDSDSARLCLHLQNLAPRIAVKRPLRAGHLGGMAPHCEVKTTQARFDIYLNHHGVVGKAR